MKIPLPNRLLDWLEHYHEPIAEWLNSRLFIADQFEIRLVDLLLIFFFVVCVGWYWYAAGWLGALRGGVLYVFIAIVALWFL
jgi:hypothetical protein